MQPEPFAPSVSELSAGELMQLVGLIYQSVADDALWSPLLWAIAHMVETEGEVVDSEGARAALAEIMALPSAVSRPPLPASQTSQFLMMHFRLAQEMRRQLEQTLVQASATQGLIDKLPHGAAVVNEGGEVVCANIRLRKLLRSRPHLSLQGGHLVSAPAFLLQEALQQVLDSGKSITLTLGSQQDRLTVLLEKFHALSAQPQVVVWVSSADEAQVPIPETSLRAHFGLTGMEARLTQLLATGLLLEDVAQQLNIGMGTARTHLRHVYAKLNVHHQHQLVHAVHSSVIGWQRDRSAQEQEAWPSLHAADRREGSLRLPDGRNMAWSDLGPRDGYPVFFHHFVIGTRHLHRPELQVLRTAGLRLITIERPGVGGSDPQAHRTLTDWTRDLEAVANHLQVQHFAVIGYSEGTPYALEVGRSLSERVSHTIIVGADPPTDIQVDNLGALQTPIRAVLFVARRVPWLFSPVMRVLVQRMKQNIHQFIDELTNTLPTPDRQMYEDAFAREQVIAGIQSSIAYGDEQLIADLLLALHGWSIESVRHLPNLTFIHGAHDWFYSMDSMKKTVAQLPKAHLCEIDDGAHLLMWTHWERIVPMIGHIVRGQPCWR